jgi:PDZ domain-containing secreted protein
MTPTIFAGCIAFVALMSVLVTARFIQVVRRGKSKLERVLPFIAFLPCLMAVPLHIGDYSWATEPIDIAPSVGLDTPTNLYQVTVRSAPAVLGTWIMTRRHPDTTATQPDDATDQQSSIDTAETSRLEAVVAAARHRKIPVTITGSGVEIIDTPPDSGLRVGDVITAINGERVYTRTDYVEATYDTTATTFEIDISGTRKQLPKTVLRRTDVVSTEDVQANVEAIDDNNSTGGDSGGLAFTLGLLIRDNALAKPDCPVLITGGITYNGDVVAIGGVSHKTQAAIDKRACFFLVPRANYREATTYAKRRVNIVGVCTLAEAIEAIHSKAN